MKKFSTKVALAVVCWAVVAAQAVAQMVGGVNYKIVSKTDKTAEVTWLVGDDDDPFADDPVYTGEVVIPEKVKIAGVDYTVVGVGKMAFADANLKNSHCHQPSSMRLGAVSGAQFFPTNSLSLSQSTASAKTLSGEQT